MADTSNKKNIREESLRDLSDFLTAQGEKAFRAKQIWQWIWQRGVTDFAEMSNLSKATRELLSRHYFFDSLFPQQVQTASDGTEKTAWRLTDGEIVESVLIPGNQKFTVCVSSQVGCQLGCKFCATGTLGFKRNLTAGEIFEQVVRAQQAAEAQGQPLSNIVFMGMGEPLDNVDELFKVLEILTAPYGYAWSPKRITVSTIGVTKGLKRFLEESECHLAVSLHSPYPMERLSLMPVEKAFPAREVIDLIKQYDFSHQRRVSFEYIVFKNLNDSLKHAEALSCLLGGIPCRVNLIRFHAIPNVSLETSDIVKMEAFRDFLNAKGVVCTIRASRGEDIFAACGMLSTAKNVTFV